MWLGRCLTSACEKCASTRRHRRHTTSASPQRVGSAVDRGDRSGRSARPVAARRGEARRTAKRWRRSRQMGESNDQGATVSLRAAAPASWPRSPQRASWRALGRHSPRRRVCWCLANRRRCAASVRRSTRCTRLEWPLGCGLSLFLRKERGRDHGDSSFRKLQPADPGRTAEVIVCLQLTRAVSDAPISTTPSIDGRTQQ